MSTPLAFRGDSPGKDTDDQHSGYCRQDRGIYVVSSTLTARWRGGRGVSKAGRMSVRGSCFTCNIFLALQQTFHPRTHKAIETPIVHDSATVNNNCLTVTKYTWRGRNASYNDNELALNKLSVNKSSHALEVSQADAWPLREISVFLSKLRVPKQHVWIEHFLKGDLSASGAGPGTQHVVVLKMKFTP